VASEIPFLAASANPEVIYLYLENLNSSLHPKADIEENIVFYSY